MKVASHYISISYVAIDSEGKEVGTIHIMSISGCWETKQFLEKEFGIITSTTTIWKRNKSFFATKYRWHESKEYMLAYLNWALNFPKSERCQFFDDELDKSKYLESNPIKNILIRISDGKPI